MIAVNLLQPRTGKRCKCGAFGPFRRRPNGAPSGVCMSCQRAYDAARYSANPEPVRQRARAWSRANGERRRAISRAWNRSNVVAHRERQRRYAYGVTPDQVHDMWLAQGQACAICRCSIRDLGPGGKGQANGMHVDHDHVTGRVRGLLCANCNTGIGLLGDDADRAEAAARYLRGDA